MDVDATVDYYRVLGLTSAASKADIKEAFTRLALKHHPDQKGGNGSGDMMKLILEARNVLLDHATRKQYDQARTAHANAWKRPAAPPPRRTPPHPPPRHHTVYGAPQPPASPPPKRPPPSTAPPPPPTRPSPIRPPHAPWKLRVVTIAHFILAAFPMLMLLTGIALIGHTFFDQEPVTRAGDVAPTDATPLVQQPEAPPAPVKTATPPRRRRPPSSPMRPAITTPVTPRCVAARRAPLQCGHANPAAAVARRATWDCSGVTVVRFPDGTYDVCACRWCQQSP